ASIEGRRVGKFEVYRRMGVDPDRRAGQRKLRSETAGLCGDLVPMVAQFRPDVIYAHSADAAVCEATLRAVACVYRSGEMPNVVAELPFRSETTAQNFYGQQLKVMLARLRATDPQLLDGFIPVTVNRTTSELLSTTVEHPIQTVPSPYASTHRRQARTDRNAPVRIGCVGYQAERKGFDLLPDVIALSSQHDRPLQFFVQIQSKSNPQTVARLRRLANEGIPLELIDRPMDRQGYNEFMRRLDILLLPYDPECYRNAISGVCYETLAQGSVIVAPEKCTVGEIVRQFQPRSPMFADWTSACIAESLKSAIIDLETYEKDAFVGSDAYLGLHGPDNYARCIVQYGQKSVSLSPIAEFSWLAKAVWKARGWSQVA
ncbi:MAG: hypothetical protein AAGC97_20285, partial [Planctomycetota bacterium]